MIVKKRTLTLAFILMLLSLWISVDRITLIERNRVIMGYWMADYAYVQTVEKLNMAISKGRSVYCAPAILYLHEPIEIPSGVNDIHIVGGNFVAVSDFPDNRAMIEISRVIVGLHLVDSQYKLCEKPENVIKLTEVLD